MMRYTGPFKAKEFDCNCGQIHSVYVADSTGRQVVTAKDRAVALFIAEAMNRLRLKQIEDHPDGGGI